MELFDIHDLVNAANSDHTKKPIEVFADEEIRSKAFIDEKTYKRQEVILIASTLLAQSFRKNRYEYVNSDDAEHAIQNARTLINSVNHLTKPHLNGKRVFVQYNKLNRSGVIRFFNLHIQFKHVSSPRTFSEYHGYTKYITLLNYRIKFRKYDR